MLLVRLYRCVVPVALIICHLSLSLRHWISWVIDSTQAPLDAELRGHRGGYRALCVLWDATRDNLVVVDRYSTFLVTLSGSIAYIILRTEIVDNFEAYTLGNADSFALSS